MIQFSESLADAYVMPRRNVAMPSQPGRQVKFLQGHAVIKDGRDLAAMLKRSDVLLVLTPYSLNWIETIERAAGEVRAEVRRPDVHRPVQMKTEEEVPDREEASAFNISEPPPKHARPKPYWDPSWPRDPKTGRLMKRSETVGTDSPDVSS